MDRIARDRRKVAPVPVPKQQTIVQLPRDSIRLQPSDNDGVLFTATLDSTEAVQVTVEFEQNLATLEETLLAANLPGHQRAAAAAADEDAKAEAKKLMNSRRGRISLFGAFGRRRGGADQRPAYAILEEDAADGVQATEVPVVTELEGASTDKRSFSFDLMSDLCLFF